MESATTSKSCSCGCKQKNAEMRQAVEEIVRRVVNSVVAENGGLAETEMLVPIEVSARHMHITPEDFAKLFGPDAKLSKLRDLSQPGEFAANESVTVVGPKRRMIDKVRILGPHRKFTQIELSYTDGIFLGIDLPHRLSGDIQGSAPITLVGPKGAVNMPQGAIRAQRHIHMNPAQAEKWGLKPGQKVNVETRGPMKIVFSNVIVRINEAFNLSMHIDTDEANAAGIQSGEPGVIVP